MPGLDILRGLAIAGVVLYHGIDGRVPWTTLHGLTSAFVYSTTWGATGVQLFFILSGFLITGILLDNKTRADYYTRFYFNRVCRILPAYLLILGVLKSMHIISWKYVLACLLYIANMAKLVGAENREYGAFWSLAVEEQFYLIWPVLVRRFSLRALTRSIWIYLIVSPIFFSVVAVFLPHLDLEYKLWGNAIWLLLGALVAITLRSGQLHAGNIRKWIYWLLPLGVLLIPLTVYLDIQPVRTDWQNRLLMPLFRMPTLLMDMGLLLIVVLRNRGKEEFASRGWFAKTFSFLGYISYGLYLVHPLVYDLTNRWFQGGWLGTYATNFGALLAIWGIGLGIAIAISFLSRLYFEEFFLQIKDRRARMKTRKSLKEALVEHKA